MKKSCFTEEQIITALKRYEAGEKTSDLCRELEKNESAFESFSGLRDECLDMHWFSAIRDARNIFEDWRDDCNERPSHTSRGGMTPSQFAKTKALRFFC